jgi:hypothetical protein
LGKVVPKTALSFEVPAVTVRGGKTLVHEFRLTDTQRTELHERHDVNFRVRLAVSGTTKRFREVFVRTRVPAELSA